MFDDLAKGLASTLSGVFGDTYTYSRPSVHSFDVQLVIRRDVELLDEHEQVVGRTNTVRIAHIDFMNASDCIITEPQRGDTVIDGTTVYTVGKRLADDGYAFLYEVTK